MVLFIKNNICLIIMNDIIEDHYIKYFECLSTNDKDLCDRFYLNEKKKETNKYKETWRFVNRGNFIKK